MGLREPEVLVHERDAPVLQFPAQALAVPDYLLGVGRPELPHLEQGLSERGHSVPVDVVHDPPGQVLPDLGVQLVAVRSNEPSLRTEAALVSGTIQDVSALLERLLELPTCDEAEDMRAVVDEGSVGVLASILDGGHVVREQYERRAKYHELRL